MHSHYQTEPTEANYHQEDFDDEVLLSEEESEESDDNETANDSDNDHDIAKESINKIQKTDGHNLIKINESFIDQKDN